MNLRKGNLVLIVAFRSHRKDVEKCVPDDADPRGYTCEYSGCPKFKNLCDDDRTKCVDDKDSMQGFRCVDKCLDVSCSNVESCNHRTGQCEYRGCSTGMVACGWGRGCMDDPLSAKGYKCLGML